MAQLLEGKSALITGAASLHRLLEVATEMHSLVLDVNVRGPLYMRLAVVPTMRKQQAGSIINMSCVPAQRGGGGGVFGGSHDAAAKAAVLGCTKATARELGADNIRVNTVCPSSIDITGDAMTPERLDAPLQQVPMGRSGQGHEVAGCSVFLASDPSSHGAGSEIDANGGSHIH